MLVYSSPRVFPLLLSAIVVCAGCGSGAGQAARQAGAPASSPAAPVVLTPSPGPQRPLDGYVPGVANFGFVTADVWRGAQPTSEGFRTLAAMGVRTVIDLQEDDHSPQVPPGVRYVPIRVSGWHADDVDTDAVLRAIAENPKPVFIHCHQGRDRTGLAVAAYRLSQGMSTADAIKELRRFRVNFWWGSPIEKRIRQLARRTTAPAE
jgi:tyrosine-protein phosphatase SIW14